MKNRNIFTSALFIIILIVAGSFITDKPKSSKNKPLNIILFIGDGMGPAQVSAAIAASSNPLIFEYFPYAGFIKTSSYDDYITDSGAGGTAMACGVKTRNGMIGMGPDTSVVVSIMELAHQKGLATGLVSTSSITHATPASFVAHNSGRGNYEDIAKDFMNDNIDVFIGGGSDHFNKRKDSTDLTLRLKEQGYDVVYNIDDLMRSKSGKLAGLLAPVHMGKPLEGRQGLLEQMTEKAIQTLSKNNKGFILMVEGSQIDFAGHAGDFQWNLSEVIDLNNAIVKAFDYATVSRNTLVIVTADHETGGLILSDGDLKTRSVAGKFCSNDHTAVMVPVFSFGPGAEKFSGIHENTFFFHEFASLLGLKK
jgi:alkaline phosphatase